MSGFLQRESDSVGEESGTRIGRTYATIDFDFSRAASDFPKISLDGTDDFFTPLPATPPIIKIYSSSATSEVRLQRVPQR